MELNEALIKVDMTLDSTVKKIEKQARDISAQELLIELSQSQNCNNLFRDYSHSFIMRELNYYLILSEIFTNENIVPVLEYIK